MSFKQDELKVTPAELSRHPAEISRQNDERMKAK